jgi:hypothetical protein
MRYAKKSLFLVSVLTMMFTMFSCSDNSDDPMQNQNQTPNNNTSTSGPVTITDISSGVFSGDELTIKGTGFSAVKEENVVKFIKLPPLSCPLQYTSAAGGDIELISATATQLKIKVPLRLVQGNPACGPLRADIEVCVKDKKDTYAGVTFGPLPYIGTFNYHYGWFDVPDVTRVGDSVMLRGGLIATGPNDSEYWDDVRLSVDGKNIPIKFRSVGLESGWAFLLPVKDYADINCSEEPDGWGAREMEFKFSIQGTGKSASRKLFVTYLPDRAASCFSCQPTVSLALGETPEWVIHGLNMSYSEARFFPATCCGASQGMGITAGQWTDEIKFEIPLSILAAGCAYNVYLTNLCDTTYLSQINIMP